MVLVGSEAQELKMEEDKIICEDCGQEVDEDSSDFCEMCGVPCCCGDYMNINGQDAYVCETCKWEYEEDEGEDDV